MDEARHAEEKRELAAQVGGRDRSLLTTYRSESTLYNHSRPDLRHAEENRELVAQVPP